MSGNITRRAAVGLLGASGAAAAFGREGREGGPPTPPGVSIGGPASERVLRAGTAFGRWSIARVHEVDVGALRVDVLTREGGQFPLEILARDPSGSRPPAAAGELAIHVPNGGDGWAPTEEEHGLAAMALASLLDARGQATGIDGLLTHGERLAEKAGRDTKRCGFG